MTFFKIIARVQLCYSSDSAREERNPRRVGTRASRWITLGRQSEHWQGQVRAGVQTRSCSHCLLRAIAVFGGRRQRPSWVMGTGRTHIKLATRGLAGILQSSTETSAKYRDVEDGKHRHPFNDTQRRTSGGALLRRCRETYKSEEKKSEKSEERGLQRHENENVRWVPLAQLQRSGISIGRWTLLFSHGRSV